MHSSSRTFIGSATRTINNLHLAVGQTGVLVYPLTTNPKNPIIQCTSAMLMACGAAGDFWQDPTGTYLLLQLRNTFDIAKINIADKEIVDTGSTFPATQTPYFSRDEAIMYGVQYNFDHVSVIQVYGFDANSGALTTGGQASVPASLWSVVAAQRQ
ncbi:MAG TPA: hypothetical protein VFA89_00250 [Terriglobales bacterium]|nr:hypothetical protein [Terriglobales bacterium]